MNKVEVILNGFSENAPDDVMLANCTTTLVRGKSSRIIVDTRTAWDGDALKSELAKRDISPDDITHVVCTHGHSDHVGCNFLFLKARQHIVGQSISHRTEYRSHDFAAGDYELDEGIRVTATPGHTLDSVSVIVGGTNSGRTVAICGDLFEKAEDCQNEKIWIDAGSESEAQQREQRHRIAQMADVIVPGHGEAFKVTAEIRSLLEKQRNKDQ